LFGEALVVCHQDVKPDFRFMVKQRGAMLAKGWLLGIQFEELFSNNLFYDLASHANEMAAILRRGIEKCGYSFLSDSMTNQLFPILPGSMTATPPSGWLLPGLPAKKHAAGLSVSWKRADKKIPLWPAVKFAGHRRLLPFTI